MVMASEDIAEEFSFEREKEIAKGFSTRFQWEMMAIGLGQALVWLTLWPLVIYEILPLWLGFIIATLCACLAYLPSHESQHGNYSRGKANLRWLDTFIGNISLITLSFPYEILRATHMKHHAYTNVPEKDFDYDIKDSKSVVEVILKVADGAQKYDAMMENFADLFFDEKIAEDKMPLTYSTERCGKQRRDGLERQANQDLNLTKLRRKM